MFCQSEWLDLKLKIIAYQISYYKYRSRISWNEIALGTVVFVFIFVAVSIIKFFANFVWINSMKAGNIHNTMYVY